MIRRICLPATTVSALLVGILGFAGAASAAPRALPGAVYTQTNLPSGNAVVWFARSRTGRLTQVGAYPTGGVGAPNSHSHFPITDSSRSLVINPQKTLLFVVNHGSGSITSFRIRPNGGLQRAFIVPSGGTGPASLAIRGDGLLYVANEAPPASIRGFRVTPGGRMLPISGTTRTLAYPNSSPGQVGFDRSGKFLIVTDRFGGASEADQDYFEIFRLSRAGLPTALPPVRSVPPEPYAFAFTSRNEMLVADAANNAPGASFTSSYLFRGGGLTQVATAPTGQSAGCWIVITANDRFAFVSSGFSTTILAYSISRGGAFRNISPGGAYPLSGIGGDLALSAGSQFLYALNIDPKLVNMDLTARSDIDAYRVGPNGSLTRIGTFAGGQLPFTSSGLAAL
jgi:6-phosphogluconolactonase (cycloisomerase 2 family)